MNLYAFSARSFALLLGVLLVGLSPIAGHAQRFHYQDLHPAEWISSVALCVNDVGEVIGYGTTQDGERGFLWTHGMFREILPPGADSAKAYWINGKGEIAGTVTTGGVPHAFLLRDGVYLDPTPGWGWSEANYIGEDGSVAGRGQYGVYISRNGVIEIFPGFTSVAGGNLSGQWVGSAGSSSMLYLPGQGYLDVTFPGATEATPHGINESGLIAGAALRAGSMKGYVKSGEFYIDMTPQGWFSSQATAINDQNEVAGYGGSSFGTRSFFRSGGTTEEIAVPGWRSTEAASLNNAGQIAGSGITTDGQTHAFLASPSASPGAAGGCSLTQTAETAESSFTPAAAALLILPLLLIRRPGRSRSCRRST